MLLKHTRVKGAHHPPVPQGYALFKHMTVKENITFGPRIRKLDVDLDAK